MIETIELPHDAERESTNVFGWRVVVSPQLWKHCVEVPKGVEGQSEGGRLHDLLAQLRFYLIQVAVPYRHEISNGFGFSVNVVNDNRRRNDHPDGLECPGEHVPVAVFASFCEDGGPCLVVLLRSEAAPLCM